MLKVKKKNSDAACKHELQFTFKAGKQNKELNFWSDFSTNKAKASDFF